MKLNKSNSTSQNLSVANKVSPYAIRSIKILELSSSDLSKEISRISEYNLFIEVEESFYDKNISSKTQTDSNFLNNCSSESIHNNNFSSLDLFDIENQTKEIFSDGRDLEYASYLINNLSNTGLLEIPLKEIAKENNLDKNYLKHIQNILIVNIIPIGIFCESSSQYIETKIHYLYGTNSYEKKIFEKAVYLKNKIKLQKYLNSLSLSRENINKAMSNISRISPSPYDIEREAVQYITPDIIVTGTIEAIQINFNHKSLPSIRINNNYLDMLKTNNLTSSFLDHQRKESLEIVHSINKRQSAISVIASIICNHQKRYIMGLSNTLLPINLSDIAEITKTHISSIARTIMNKYVDCPIGLVPLKSLLSKSFKSSKGDLISSCKLKEAIKNIINKEDLSNPITDGEIAKKLNSIGLPCARRTVTKKRKIMGIECSRNRKLFNKK